MGADQSSQPSPEVALSTLEPKQESINEIPTNDENKLKSPILDPHTPLDNNKSRDISLMDANLSKKLKSG